MVRVRVSVRVRVRVKVRIRARVRVRGLEAWVLGCRPPCGTDLGRLPLLRLRFPSRDIRVWIGVRGRRGSGWISWG